MSVSIVVVHSRAFCIITCDISAAAIDLSKLAAALLPRVCRAEGVWEEITSIMIRVSTCGSSFVSFASVTVRVLCGTCATFDLE